MRVDLLYAMQNRTSKWLRLRERQKTFINSLTHMISIESQNIAYRQTGKQAASLIKAVALQYSTPESIGRLPRILHFIPS